MGSFVQNLYPVVKWPNSSLDSQGVIRNQHSIIIVSQGSGVAINAALERQAWVQSPGSERYTVFPRKLDVSWRQGCPLFRLFLEIGMRFFSTSPLNALAPMLLQYQKIIDCNRHRKAMQSKSCGYVLLHSIY
jgi:hypothetical protein